MNYTAHTFLLAALLFGPALYAAQDTTTTVDQSNLSEQTIASTDQITSTEQVVSSNDDQSDDTTLDIELDPAQIQRIILAIEIAPASDDYNQEIWAQMIVQAMTCIAACQESNDVNTLSACLQTIEDIFYLNVDQSGINGNIGLYLAVADNADDSDDADQDQTTDESDTTTDATVAA